MHCLPCTGHLFECFGWIIRLGPLEQLLHGYKEARESKPRAAASTLALPDLHPCFRGSRPPCNTNLSPQGPPCRDLSWLCCLLLSVPAYRACAIVQHATPHAVFSSTPSPLPALFFFGESFPHSAPDPPSDMINSPIPARLYSRVPYP